MSVKPQSLAETIAEQRRANGTTLRELETMTGISNGYISQVERGVIKTPSFEVVVLLSRALELGLEDLAACVGPVK